MHNADFPVPANRKRPAAKRILRCWVLRLALAAMGAAAIPMCLLAGLIALIWNAADAALRRLDRE